MQGERHGSTPGTRFPAAASLRDALYDLIPLAEPELAILGCEPFLRLERIQQLGFVSRIWPGAHHTRYEHAIGVFHLSRLALEQLRTQPGPMTITDVDARTLAAAALLHDIGHYPFSHAIEELGPPIVPHEVAGAAIIEREPVADILRESWDVDPSRVAAIVAPQGRALPTIDRLLRGLLSGPLDVDKLDYLPRDARACNVPYGGVDTARLLASLRIAGVDDETRIVVGDKGVSPLHSLINARQEMFDNVYWHHTNRACMAMLLRAVQEALLAGTIDAPALPAMDDHTLLASLMAAEMPDATRRLATALKQRQFHKRAVEVGFQAGALYQGLSALFDQPSRRREIETTLTTSLAASIGRDLPPEAILIDIPKPERWRTEVWVQFDDPPVGYQPLMPWREVVGLTDGDFKRYEEHRRLIRIVTAPACRQEARAAWEPVLLPTLTSLL